MRHCCLRFSDCVFFIKSMLGVSGHKYNICNGWLCTIFDKGKIILCTVEKLKSMISTVQHVKHKGFVVWKNINRIHLRRARFLMNKISLTWNQTTPKPGSIYLKCKISNKMLPEIYQLLTWLLAQDFSEQVDKIVLSVVPLDWHSIMWRHNKTFPYIKKNE